MQTNRIASQMKQQISVLNSIDELIKYCREKSLLDDIPAEEIDFLAKHSAAMRRACDTAIKLTEIVKKAEKQNAETAKRPTEKKAPKETPENKELDFLD